MGIETSTNIFQQKTSKTIDSDRNAGSLAILMKALTRIAWSMAAAATCIAFPGCLSDAQIAPQFQARLSLAYVSKAVLRPIDSEVTVFDLFNPDEFKAKFDELQNGGNTLVGYARVVLPVPQSHDVIKQKAREVGANVVLITGEPMVGTNSPAVADFVFWSTKANYPR